MLALNGGRPSLPGLGRGDGGGGDGPGVEEAAAVAHDQHVGDHHWAAPERQLELLGPTDRPGGPVDAHEPATVGAGVDHVAHDGGGAVEATAEPALVVDLPHDATARHRRIDLRSEEHTSELQSLMRTSYAALCLKKKKNNSRTQKQET